MTNSSVPKFMRAVVSAAAGLGFAAVAHAQSAGPYYATPAWSQTLATGVRFIVLTNFSSEAVLDRETGLVWARSPIYQTDASVPMTYVNAKFACLNTPIGGRYGWRLPGVSELTTLLDPTKPRGTAVSLPDGHPFLGFRPVFHWTLTSAEDSPGVAFPTVKFTVWFTGPGGATTELIGESRNVGALCVRAAGVAQIY